MTAHELAQLLLNGPDLPVAIYENSYGIPTLSPIVAIEPLFANYAKQNVLRFVVDSTNAYDYP